MKAVALCYFTVNLVFDKHFLIAQQKPQIIFMGIVGWINKYYKNCYTYSWEYRIKNQPRHNISWLFYMDRLQVSVIVLQFFLLVNTTFVKTATLQYPPLNKPYSGFKLTSVGNLILYKQLIL